MTTFTAILLVCALGIPAPDCVEANATDLFSTQVRNELGCAHGFEEMVARGALREGVGETLYLKTLCRRNISAARAD